MEDHELDAAVLRIQTLGLFQAWRKQKTLKWPTRKCKALLQILLIEPGQLVSTEQILVYLWPDLPARKAQNNLWVTVSQLRRLLQPDLPARTPSIYIHKQDQGYRFNLASDYWLDGESFTAHLSAAQAAPDLLAKIDYWEAARNLYHGDYLEDELYAEWTQLPRAQWGRRYEQLLINLAEAYGQNGRFQQAITTCREILALDNTNETAYRLLMRCHASLGERALALKAYDEAVQNLQAEIGVDPMPETVRVAQQIRNLDGDWKLELEEWTFSRGESSLSLPFVGRGVEIDKIAQLVDQAVAGQGKIALISGEPGIGKSRLIKETIGLASQQHFHPFSTHCYQIEQSMPYLPLINLIRQVMLYDDRWHLLPRVWLRELSVLVPEMEELVTAVTSGTPSMYEPDENQQGRLFQAIFRFFAYQAERQNMLLVVEDIHWADPATLLCLSYLSHHFEHVPIVLILSFREESLSAKADLNTLLNSLQREENVTSFSLARLTEADTIELLGQSVATGTNVDHLARWLHQETDGNPFFFISLLQSVREEGLLDESKHTDWAGQIRRDPKLTLPEAIRDSVRNRLQRLHQVEQEVLDWLAVYGRRLDFSTLLTISQLPQITLLNTIEQLVARQLLVESEGKYDFNHNKIREVVYYELSAARCTVYHQHIAETLDGLSQSPDKTALLAHHFEFSGQFDKALNYWMLAGKHALETYAHQQAAHHFARALALANEVTDKIDAYLGLGNAFILLDDHKAAAGVIQQGLQLIGQFDEDIRFVQLLYTLAQNASRQHRPDGGKPEVEAALVAAERTNDAYYQAQSLLLLTEVHESNGDLSSALETAKQAQAVSAILNDTRLEARAVVEIGFLHAQRAEFDEAVSAVELGLNLLAKTDDRYAIAYAWNILGRALGGRGDYSRALDTFRLCQEEATIIGDYYLLAQGFNMQGWLYRELGDYEQGLRYDQEGIEFAKLWGKPSPEISARLNVCLDKLFLGEPKQVLGLLDEIEQQINTGSFGFHGWRWRLRLLHTRGLCFESLNELPKALELAKEGLMSAEANVTRKYIALNHELMGRVLGQLGSEDEAISELETAISLADAIQYQPTRWAGRLQLAQLYHKNNLERESINISSEAEDIIHAIAASLEDEKLRVIFLNTALPQ